MSEVKLNTLSHKERKEYIKEMRRINKLESDDEKYDQLMGFRETFLKDHVGKDVDLDSMPAKDVDKLFQALESEMDFQMGLKSLMSLNTAPSSESPQTPSQEKK